MQSKDISPPTLFFFGVMFVVLGLLNFYINFRISLSISTKICYFSSKSCPSIVDFCWIQSLHDDCKMMAFQSSSLHSYQLGLSTFLWARALPPCLISVSLSLFVVNLQCYISFRCTTQWFKIFIDFAPIWSYKISAIFPVAYLFYT